MRRTGEFLWPPREEECGGDYQEDANNYFREVCDQRRKTDCKEDEQPEFSESRIIVVSQFIKKLCDILDVPIDDAYFLFGAIREAYELNQAYERGDQVYLYSSCKEAEEEKILAYCKENIAAIRGLIPTEIRVDRYTRRSPYDAVPEEPIVKRDDLTRIRKAVGKGRRSFNPSLKN